jgi:hypothetical protein
MNVAAGPELAAVVTNAGGLGVIGGLGYTPKMLRAQVYLLAVVLIRFRTWSDFAPDTTAQRGPCGQERAIRRRSPHPASRG